jgi:hypothetical protein
MSDFGFPPQQEGCPLNPIFSGIFMQAEKFGLSGGCLEDLLMTYYQLYGHCAANQVVCCDVGSLLKSAPVEVISVSTPPHSRIQEIPRTTSK